MLISSYKLAQRSKGDGVASFRNVEQNARGLVCMTGGDEGPLAAALESGRMDRGRKALTQLVHTFGPKNVYVELQRHGICEQEARNQAAISLAREFHLPLLATKWRQHGDRVRARDPRRAHQYTARLFAR